METPKQREKRLRMAKAKMEDDVDYDWAYFDERVEILEDEMKDLEDGVVRDAIGLVIVQVYLNRMRRDWDEAEENDQRARD